MITGKGKVKNFGVHQEKGSPPEEQLRLELEDGTNWIYALSDPENRLSSILTMIDFAASRNLVVYVDNGTDGRNYIVNMSLAVPS